MGIGGGIWDGGPINSVDAAQSRGGWELESARFAASRAGQELASLRASSVDASDLDRAERRYRFALHLLQRIRTSLYDSSIPD